MTSAAYSLEQKDALQELLNIAMGQAADSLARVLSAYVQLAIPSIEIIEAHQLADALSHIAHEGEAVTAARQAFFNDLQGEAVAVYGNEDSRHVADLMGYDELDSLEEQELLLDITNVLVGACMTGFGKLIDANIGYSAPRMMAVNVPMSQLFSSEKPSWNQSLLIKINFGIHERSFLCELLFFMPESSIAKVQHGVDAFLEAE